MLARSESVSDPSSEAELSSTALLSFARAMILDFDNPINNDNCSYWKHHQHKDREKYDHNVTKTIAPKDVTNEASQNLTAQLVDCCLYKTEGYS